MNVMIVAVVAGVAGWMAEVTNRRFQCRIGVPPADIERRRRRWPVTATLFAAFVAALWVVEVGYAGLFPTTPLPLEHPGYAEEWTAVARGHWTFYSHAVLLWILWCVSLTDFDERLIPDVSIFAGTTLGIVAAAVPAQYGGHLFLVPWAPPNPQIFESLSESLPEPFIESLQAPSAPYEPLTMVSPQTWESAAHGGVGELCTALAILTVWCFALMPRTWYPRHGLCRAVRLCATRMWRVRDTQEMWIPILLTIFLASMVFGAYGMEAQNGRIAPLRDLNHFKVLMEPFAWARVYSAVIGMAVGGGLVWYVRIVGRLVLRREAMGFGDVTLMAMLGVWFGWQGVLVIFLLAPIFGLLFGVAMVVFQRRPMPYGPFLAAAAVTTLFGWRTIWDTISPTLSLFSRAEIAMVGGGMLLLMGPLLWIVRTLRVRVFGMP